MAIIRHNLTTGEGGEVVNHYTWLFITRKQSQEYNNTYDITVTDGVGRFNIIVNRDGTNLQLVFDDIKYHCPHTNLGRELYKLPDPNDNEDSFKYSKYIVTIAKILKQCNKRAINY